ncbi:YdcF family protein [Pelagibius sp. Alg239-R121]|uniref:YdcF family protein n=1 Tax=Pelagibius sp. Alg239-R121 TaxID=2993448 RepID=UPI0024A7368E|nr:YdcF family protein [Pelagibius sp. Alg239-R121]
MLSFLYYIKPLFLPPMNFILLALVGWLCTRRWPVLGRRIIMIAVAGLLLLSLPAVSGVLLSSLQVHPPLDTSQPVAEDSAIVVLAAGMYVDAPEYGGDTAGGLTLERLRYAAKLHRDLGLPVMTTGGITGDFDTPLSDAMAKVLTEEFGVETVWTEDESLNTKENATNSEALLQSHGVSTVYLVTHSWHMRRAVLVFESAGLSVIPAPTRLGGIIDIGLGDFIPNAGALYGSYYALHEWLGQIWYLWVYT